MTQSETRSSSHLISGSLVICNSSTFALFDSRATHSFISLLHAKFLDHRVKSLVSEFID